MEQNENGNSRDEENPLTVRVGYKWLGYELIFSFSTHFFFLTKTKYMVFLGFFSSFVLVYGDIASTLNSIPEVKILVDLTIVLWVSFNFTFNNRIFYGSFSFFFLLFVCTNCSSVLFLWTFSSCYYCWFSFFIIDGSTNMQSICVGEKERMRYVEGIQGHH